MIRYVLSVAILACGAAGAQSLWNIDRPPTSLFADTTARSTGDVLTVIIAEKQSVKNKEDTDFSNSASLDAVLTNFDVLPNAFNPLPHVTASDQRQFKGTAKYDKEGTFETRLSLVVIDVQPNGCLVVEGRRTIIIDRETKVMRVTGIVRPFDITSDNTINSWQLANASLAYEGKGALTNSTNRGWLGELLDFIWPF